MFALPALPTPVRLSKYGSRATLGPVLALAALALSICSAAPAQAALISTSACSDATLSQPFLQWGDSSSYELVPGGDFEGSLSGWTLSGGAQRVAGSEPYGATGSV